MKYLLVAAMSVVLLLPPVSAACSCVSIENQKKPRSSEVRRRMDEYLSRNTHVLRVRVTAKTGITDRFEFTVLDSWKGTYKIGDVLLARSGDVGSCVTTVQLGDEVLVGFNDLADAYITVPPCPLRSPDERRKLEDKFLQKLSRKYRDRGTDSEIKPNQTMEPTR